MSQQTAMNALVELLKVNDIYKQSMPYIIEIIEEVYLPMEKQQIIEEIIGFQIYLNDEGYINNHDWDFEKEAIYYLHKNQIK